MKGKIDKHANRTGYRSVWQIISNSNIIFSNHFFTDFNVIIFCKLRSTHYFTNATSRHNVKLVTCHFVTCIMFKCKYGWVSASYSWMFTRVCLSLQSLAVIKFLPRLVGFSVKGGGALRTQTHWNAYVAGRADFVVRHPVSYLKPSKNSWIRVSWDLSFPSWKCLRWN